MARKIFENVRLKSPKYSAFDMSHDVKMSLNMGKLYPIFHEEIVPGDQFSCNSEVFMRMAPMIAPIMHKVDVYVHWFFVPNRIIWDQWEDFITGGKLGDQVISVPQCYLGSHASAVGKLPDYFGLPTGMADSTLINALPFRAYAEIYNEYYRDQNLSDPIDYTLANWGFSNGPWCDILSRAWEKDYFTSALPWTQRGPEVLAPIAGSFSPQYEDTSLVREDDGTVPAAGDLNTDAVGDMGITGSGAGRIENLSDPQTVTGVEMDIRELRRSARLQEFFEKAARFGSRYKEQLLGYFGVRSSDARLDRPEYLGGGKQPMVVSEVLNTSATATEPQGNMAGHGVTVGGKNSFKKKFEEHGHCIAIMSVLPRTAYQQGIHRYFTRDDRFDYYWPEFANIGEQEVFNYEIYQAPATVGLQPGTFGYQQRYAEYKQKSGRVCGDFRTTLDNWHMGRIFSSAPSLNEAFVMSDPTDRIFAVTGGSDELYCHVYHSVKARRPMPYFSDPRL